MQKIKNFIRDYDDIIISYFERKFGKNKLFFSEKKIEKSLDGLDRFVKKEFGFKNFVSNEVFIDKENDKITLLFPREISFIIENSVIK